MKALRIIPVIVTALLLLTVPAPAQWPPTVSTGDKITAAAWNEIISALQTWGGDVDANTNALTNLDHVELVPRILPTTPATGTLLSDSADGNKLKFYDGSSWVTFTTPAGSTGQYQYNSGAGLAGGLLYDTGTLIGIGGTTSAYPALKRSGNGLQIKYADDSGFGSLTAGVITSYATDSRFVSYETDAPANEKYWLWVASAGDWLLRLLDDTYANGVTALSFTRNATTPYQATFYTERTGFYNALPTVDFYENDAGVDNKYWRFYVNNQYFNFQILNDSYGGAQNIFSIGRTGATPGGFSFYTKIQSNRTFPNIEWYETDAPTDEKYWRSVMAAGQWRLETVNDAYNTARSAYIIDRSGIDPLNHQFYIGSSIQVIISGSGLKIYDTGTKPTCSSSIRGYIWRDEGGAGVADTVEICVKLADGSYVWKTMI